MKEQLELFLLFRANKRKRRVYAGILLRASICFLAFIVAATILLYKRLVKLWQILLANIFRNDTQLRWVVVYRINLPIDEISVKKKSPPNRVFSYLISRWMTFRSAVEHQPLFRLLTSKYPI